MLDNQTVGNNYCKSGNFHEGFIFAKLRDMEKSFCRLLILVNHALVANLNVASMSFNAIRENKILAKISGFTVSLPAIDLQYGKELFASRSFNTLDLPSSWGG